MLAARGQHRCPDCFKYLLIYVQDRGMEIELLKEIMTNNMQGHLATNNIEAYNTARQDLNKLLYPDVESESERMMRLGKEMLKGPETIKIGKKSNGSALDLKHVKKVYVNG